MASSLANLPAYKVGRTDLQPVPESLPCSRRTLAVCVRGAVIAAVLLLHVALRLHALQRRPLAALGCSYPHCYSTSLSLLAGRGFYRLPLANDAASEPLKRFLDVQAPSLAATAFADYLQSIPESSASFGKYAYLDAARAFDLYVAAGIWKAFGISWFALGAFYVGISALAGLAVLLTTWRLSKSFWAGALAAALFAVSPFEVTQSVKDLRDTNPTWFAAFGFFVLLWVTNRFKSRWANGASFLLLGAVSLVGYGWRSDALVFPPFFLAASMVQLALARTHWRVALGVLACFALGVAGVWLVLRGAHDLPRQVMETRFHIAYFGEETRCNLLGVENSLQIFRDDSKTLADAMAFQEATEPDVDPPLYCAPGYGVLCKTMYLKALRHNLYLWVSRAPRTLWCAISGCPEPMKVQGVAIPALTADLPARAARLLARLCRLFAILFPLLAVLGGLAVFARSLNRTAAGILVCFVLYYTAIWFCVAPEQRHWGPLLAPLCVLAGLSVVVVHAVGRSLREGEWRGWLRDCGTRHVLAGVGAGCLAWLIACAIAYQVSTRERGAYRAELLARAAGGVDVSWQLNSPHVFTASAAGGHRCARGYMLTIATGNQPGELTARHLRLGTDSPDATSWPPGRNRTSVFEAMRNSVWWSTFSKTRHRLQPAARQYFFVSFLRSSRSGDHRPCALKVETAGDARIVEAVEIDLSDWNRLQVNTVFPAEGEAPVSPFVGGRTTQTLQRFATTPETLGELGLAGLK